VRWAETASIAKYRQKAGQTPGSCVPWYDT
jgi:hypothetical protein